MSSDEPSGRGIYYSSPTIHAPIANTNPNKEQAWLLIAADRPYLLGLLAAASLLVRVPQAVLPGATVEEDPLKAGAEVIAAVLAEADPLPLSCAAQRLLWRD